MYFGSSATRRVNKSNRFSANAVPFRLLDNCTSFQRGKRKGVAALRSDSKILVSR